MAMFQLLSSNLLENLKCMFLKMRMWIGYIVSLLTERKNCLLMLNVKWQNIYHCRKDCRRCDKCNSYGISCRGFWDSR